MKDFTKKFLEDGFFYSIPSILTRGITFLMLPIYTRALAPSEFGNFDLVIVISNLLQIVFTLEVTQALARFSTEHQDMRQKSEYISTGFLFTFLVYMTFFMAINFTNFPLEYLYLRTEIERFIFSIYLLSFGGFYFLQNQLKWEMKSRLFAIVSLAVAGITACSTLYFVYILELKVIGMLLGLSVGYMSGSVMAFFYLSNLFTIKFNFVLLKELLGFSYPLAAAGVLLWGMNSIDRLMITHFLGLTELGLYSFALKIAMMTPLLMIGFQTALGPLIYNKYKDPETRDQIAQIFISYVSFGLILCLLVTIFSDTIIDIIAPASFKITFDLVALLTFGTFIISLDIFTCGFGIQKKTVLLIPINVSAILMKLILNYLLMSHLELVGIAIANLIVATSIIIIKMKISQTLYFIPFHWSKVILLFMCVTIIIMIYFFFKDTAGFSIRITLLILALGIVLSLNKFFSDRVKYNVKT